MNFTKNAGRFRRIFFPSCPSAGRFVDDGKNLYREGSGGSVRYAAGSATSPNLLFEIGRDDRHEVAKISDPGSAIFLLGTSRAEVIEHLASTKCFDEYQRKWY